MNLEANGFDFVGAEKVKSGSVGDELGNKICILQGCFIAVGIGA